MILWLSVIGVVLLVGVAVRWKLRDRDSARHVAHDADRPSLPNDQLGL